MVQKSFGFVRCQKVSYFIAKATYFPLLPFLPVLDGTAVAMSVFGTQRRSAESATPSTWGYDYKDSYYSLHTDEHLTAVLISTQHVNHLGLWPVCTHLGQVRALNVSNST